MDLLLQDVLESNGGDAAVTKLRQQAENEQLDSSETFALIARGLEGLLAKREDIAQDLMCGVAVLAQVKGNKSSSQIHLDLKSASTPLIKANKECDVAAKADIRVIFETEDQFRGVMSQRLDFMKLVQLGQIQTEGSLRTKMKLMGLAEVAKRLEQEGQERRNREAMASISWENEPLRGSFRGLLEKKSEWLKNWNQRYFILEWDPFNRPTLSYAVREGEPPRDTIELHTSCTVQARVTTRRDKLHQAAFALVDRRSGEDLLVLCAPSEEVRADWLRCLKAAITARARGRAHAAAGGSVAGGTSVAGESQPATPRKRKTIARPPMLAATGVSTSSLLPTPGRGGQREDTSDSGDAEEYESTIDAQLLADVSAQLVASGVESHLAFILRKLNWAVVPMLVTAGLAIHSLARYTIELEPPTLWEASSVVAGTTVVAGLLTKSSFFELLRRRVSVLSLAAKLIVDLKITDMKTSDMPPMHADATWRVKQRAVAEQVYANSLSLGGLWVKVAQHMGARADIMPEGIVNVLSRLQDEVPPTPFAQLKPHLERELGVSIQEAFSEFQEIPIAAASIGQVHIGRLREDGAKVVIKVQHPGVDRLLRQDVQNMGLITSWIGIVDRRLSDMARDVMDHWRKNVLNELDFHNEVSNMTEVGASLATCDEVYASVPTVVESLCSRRVITMRFVRGCKVTDFDALANVGVAGLNSRSNLADDICNAFAHQIFIGGLVNADPHPGNVLVAKRSDVSHNEIMRLPETMDKAEVPRAVPVILDFGLALRVPDQVRYGLARVVLAGSQLDAGGLFEGSDVLGIRLTRENLLDDFGGLQHLMRDTAPPDESRQQALERMEIERKKWEQQNFEIPVEAFPPELILMIRSLQLVRALCSTLRVRQPFIKTLASWAHRALLERYPEPATMLDTPRDVSESTHQSASAAALERKLREAIKDHAEEIQGIQVAVICKDGVISIAEGQLSHIDRRPVSRETLFPGLALAQSVAQICVHAELARIGSAPDEALLSGDLSQISFDPTAVPSTFDSKNARDWKSHLEFIKEISQKSQTNGGDASSDDDSMIAGAELPYEFSHLAFSWGWAVMSLLQGKTTPSEGLCIFAQKARELSPNLLFGLESEEEAKELLEAGKLAQSSFPVEKLMEQHGVRDVGSMGSVETMGDQNPLSMVSEAVPTLKGKEFWLDPRMTNVPRLAAACLPAMNLLCTADAMAEIMHHVGGCQDHDSEVLHPDAVERIRDSVGKSGDDPFAGGRLGLRKFKFSRKDGQSQTIGIGQIAFGGNALLTFPDLSVTICILVNQLSMDSAPTQACLDVLYQTFEIASEGDY